MDNLTALGLSNQLLGNRTKELEAKNKALENKLKHSQETSSKCNVKLQNEKRKVERLKKRKNEADNEKGPLIIK